jgi:predicted Zn-dependent protease
MSQGALDRNTFEAIEAYVIDRMDVDERTVFEQRMATEPGLREEVEVERENIRAVELGGVKRMLNEIAQEEGTQSGGLSGSGWGTYLKYAAVIALVATGAIWWFTRAPLNERLFAEHFVPDPGLPVEMGVADDPVFADAMVSYREGHYAEARSKWMAPLQQDLQNDTLQFYIGSAALAEGDAKAAIKQLAPLADDPSTAFHDKSRWYLFLAYVRNGSAQEAKAMGMDSDPVHGAEARAIIDAMER